jgi:3-oxoacyl-[acyl-carrier protein] reductase
MGTDAADLVVAIVGPAEGVAGAIADAMSASSAAVARFDDGAADDAAPLLDGLVDAHGRLDAFVYAATGADALEPSPFADLSIERWEASFDLPLARMITWLQAAHPHLAGAHGRVVMVQPTVGMSGAPEFAALAGLAEAQRAFVKVAARQWREQRLAVNVVAVRPDVFAPQLARSELAGTWSRVAQMGAGEGFSDPPLPLDITQDLVPLVAFLGAPAVSAMTGQTLILDGAIWMMP